MGMKACEERRYRETNPAALKLLQASSFVANLSRVFLSSRTPTPQKTNKTRSSNVKTLNSTPPQKKKTQTLPSPKKKEAQEALRLSLLSRPTQKIPNNKSQEAKGCTLAQECI
jgi:hypothetical protein